MIAALPMAAGPQHAANRNAPLVSRQSLGGAYALLTFRHAEVASRAQAGQFVMIKAGSSAEPPLRRPFSIMDADARAGTFTLFLKAVGPGSRALTTLEVGAPAQCLGPLGRGFTPPPDGVDAVLVAGGYGIAPFHLFASALLREGRGVHVFYGGRTADDLPLRAPFETLRVPLTTATEDGSLGAHGRVTEPVAAFLDRTPRSAALYACGPEAMLHAVARLAQRRGLRAQVSLDPWMGCGIGTCLGCVVRVRETPDSRPRWACACAEGPVFDTGVVVWPEPSAPDGDTA
jgi:dihydroorotate dehydrogenase electron transfer subunit